LEAPFVKLTSFNQLPGVAKLRNFYVSLYASDYGGGLLAVTFEAGHEKTPVLCGW
jgi:hypothetical protein